MQIHSTLLTLLLLTSAAHAQEVTTTHQTLRPAFDVEWNAGLAPFGGVGANVGLKPAWEPQLRFSLGFFGLTLPEFGLGESAGQGWTVLDRSLLANAQYYFRKERGGFYAGVDLVYQQRVLHREGVSGETLLHQLVVAATGGYEWFPFAKLGLYAAPNLTLSVRVAELGVPALAGLGFKESPFLPLPGINIGWEI